ncbi:O-antigen ligase family protein [Colwellia sp. MB02u-6]|uniref:O-antigen ligase family protein n=1 Tax=Colwellia sp. MB02u-6 TaxID=2759824 RepID=UPI0015F687AE|nr:O-antigen ligase family protein [Colwellia sp. MB02u-6]MBA6328723.1 O-antigen ligase family protein [Colwellia sp. MB02u-6]
MARYFPKNKTEDSPLGFFFLFLYTASVLIRPHEMFQISLQWITIQIFIIIAFGATVAMHRPIKMYPQHWMILGLVPLIIVSGFLNGSGMIGVDQSKRIMISALFPLFLYSNCITSIKRQHILMVVCLFAALLMVHNGHIQQTAYQGAGWALGTYSVGYINLGERRITYLGFFNDPNDLGMFLVMNIPFAIYFYKKSQAVSKVIMLSVLVALFYGIYLTGSRGTMLGAGALIAVYFIVMNAGPKLFITIVVLAPIAATVITSLQSNMDESADGRLEAWYAGVLMLLNNPIFGIGMGQFLEEHGLVAHNSYIHVAAELGVPGYSLWGGALIFTALTGYLFVQDRISKKKLDDAETTLPPEEEAELFLNKTLFFSLVGFMITGFFISRMFTLLLFIFLGMAIASHIRLVKLNPEYAIHFSTRLAVRSMLYCWSIIVAVYISLKLGL